MAATAGLFQIQADAAVAASGAYAATAAIPVVGPEAAPAAATLAFGNVMAYAGALDVGAWNIPRTMLATVHEGEAVVPKTYAEGLRQSGGAVANVPRSAARAPRGSQVLIQAHPDLGRWTVAEFMQREYARILATTGN